MKKYISKIKKNLYPKPCTSSSLRLSEPNGLNPKSGISLIEFITAISIFIIALTIVTGVFFSIFQVSRRSTATQNVLDEARFILEVMAKEIRTGNTFSQIGGVIQFTDAKGNLINYRQNTANYTIEKCEIIPPATCAETDFAAITSSQIKINNLSFILSGQMPSDGLQPRITISMTVSSKGDKAESITDITLQTTVSQRDLDS